MRTLLLIVASVAISTVCVAEARAQEAKKLKDCQVINEPGSYVLTDNLPSGTGLLPAGGAVAIFGDCLVINSNNVVIDGQGFTIQGGGSPGDGIRAAAGGNEHIQVRNVTVIGFERGVDLEGAFFSVIEHVSAIDNNGHGITIHSGQSNRVVNNNAISNGVAGIRVSMRSIAHHNITNGNGGVGLFVDQQSIVTENISSLNAGDGIAVTCPSLVIANVAVENGVNLSVGADCTTQNNVAP